MGKIKVLIVAGNMHVGGIENQLMHLLRNADHTKFQIDYTSCMEGAFYRQEIEALDGKFILLPQMNPKNPMPYCKALYRVMKDGKYDIVHSHELFHSGIVLKIAKMAGVPCRFVHAHNWQDGDSIGQHRGFVRTSYNTVMRRWIRKYSTVQIACSSLAGKFLYGEDYLSRSTYHLIVNSVDTSKFLNRYDHVETGEFCDPDWTNIIHVGRFSTVKNQLFLVNIAAEFKAQGDKIRFLCAGDGDTEYVDAVKKSICQNGLEDYVLLLGVRKDVDVLMRKSACFVLPSQYEGMPLVLIEAQASGLPCVVADTFSHEVDFLIDRIEWLPLAENAQTWGNALKRAIAKGRSSRTDVVQAIKTGHFDAKSFAETVCQLYLDDYKRAGLSGL